MAKIEDIALKYITHKQCKFLWYGTHGIVGEIYAEYGGKASHPLNRSAAVIGALARSKKWECVGQIEHLGRYYNCYAPKTTGDNHEQR